jgi:3-phytase
MSGMTQRGPGPTGRRSFRLVLAVASAVVLGACTSGPSGNSSSPPPAQTSTPTGETAVNARVAPTVETDPVHNDGDAADDPAIWVNPDDPAKSAIVATDKLGGLLVYDVTGKELQYLKTGDMNNVDVRPTSGSIMLGGRPVVLVVAGNRTDNTIGVYALDPETRQLRDVTAAPITPSLEVYGSCLYRTAGGELYSFVNSKKGEVEQWALADDGTGKVAGQLVRSFSVSSQVEGCVADDELGNFYLGEEQKGIWKFGAEPDAADTGTLIAQVSASAPLAGQVEGLTLTYGEAGTGYLIASSQGDSSYAVFRREGDNAYVGSFRIVAGRGIDGTDGTDGIDVTTADLGPAFPSGVFVSQDGKNDRGAQNFKLVPLQEIIPR